MFGFTVLVALFLHVAPAATSEMEYFPGLRRPPASVSNWPQPPNDEGYNLLNQLSSIIEEQARRRFQQQLAQQQYYQSQHHHGPSGQSDVAVEPSFSYQFPETNERLDGTIPFAVNPSDPRYHASNSKTSFISNAYDDDYAEPETKQSNENHLISKPSEDVPYYKLKPPMDVNPKMPANNFRDDLKALVEKLQRDGQANAILNGRAAGQDKPEVIKKHMGINDTFGMYIVALIAGISAAVTVGLLALIIGWYTLHKKAKAAADVEYPAYGVTGPNKDISSPSGDRRLAQSAQMYHYQHQKQQIIAMENRIEHQHGGISDVESDDDNEEGDYTVYECPGLAPTGEMEVKNPLFLDDTPVTPSASVAENPQAQSQKQHTPKKQMKPATESKNAALENSKPKVRK